MSVELGLEVSADDKVIELLEKITKCPLFMEDTAFVKGVLENITDGRWMTRRGTETMTRRETFSGWKSNWTGKTEIELWKSW